MMRHLLHRMSLNITERATYGTNVSNWNLCPLYDCIYCSSILSLIRSVACYYSRCCCKTSVNDFLTLSLALYKLRSTHHIKWGQTLKKGSTWHFIASFLLINSSPTTSVTHQILTDDLSINAAFLKSFFPVQEIKISLKMWRHKSTCSNIVQFSDPSLAQKKLNVWGKKEKS